MSQKTYHNIYVNNKNSLLKTKIDEDISEKTHHLYFKSFLIDLFRIIEFV